MYTNVLHREKLCNHCDDGKKSDHSEKPEDHWSCIVHLIAEDVLKSAVIEEKKFKNIECK